MCKTYEVGMHIRYGGTGICLIDRVEEVEYPGQPEPRLCYVLKPIRSTGMEVSVPMDNPQLCERMKPLLTKAEIDLMLEQAVMQNEVEWIEDRKQRNAEFRRILASGDAPQLIQLIHCILMQQTALAEKGRHLSATDENTRKEAERMLDEEFAFSLGMTPEEAGTYICEKLQTEESL